MAALVDANDSSVPTRSLDAPGNATMTEEDDGGEVIANDAPPTSSTNLVETEDVDDGAPKPEEVNEENATPEPETAKRADGTSEAEGPATTSAAPVETKDDDDGPKLGEGGDGKDAEDPDLVARPPRPPTPPPSSSSAAVASLASKFQTAGTAYRKPSIAEEMAALRAKGSVKARAASIIEKTMNGGLAQLSSPEAERAASRAKRESDELGYIKAKEILRRGSQGAAEASAARAAELTAMRRKEKEEKAEARGMTHIAVEADARPYAQEGEEEGSDPADPIEEIGRATSSTTLVETEDVDDGVPKPEEVGEENATPEPETPAKTADGTSEAEGPATTSTTRVETEDDDDEPKLEEVFNNDARLELEMLGKTADSTSEPAEPEEVTIEETKVELTTADAAPAKDDEPEEITIEDKKVELTSFTIPEPETPGAASVETENDEAFDEFLSMLNG